jgi:hypothetical protein
MASASKSKSKSNSKSSFKNDLVQAAIEVISDKLEIDDETISTFEFQLSSAFSDIVIEFLLTRPSPTSNTSNDTTTTKKKRTETCATWNSRYAKMYVTDTFTISSSPLSLLSKTATDSNKRLANIKPGEYTYKDIIKHAETVYEDNGSGKKFSAWGVAGLLHSIGIPDS